MLKNRSIGFIDLSNFDNHFAFALLLASIIEKQYDQLTILDLNDPGDNKYISSFQKPKKDSDLSSFRILDRSLYQISTNPAKKIVKMLEIANSTVNKNNNLLVCLSLKENEINKMMLDKVKELIIMGDIKSNLPDRLLKFFLNGDIKNKLIKIIIYNYEFNINNEKIMLDIRKMVNKSKSTEIITISKLNQFKLLKDIISIDPWDELYKAIKRII